MFAVKLSFVLVVCALWRPGDLVEGKIFLMVQGSFTYNESISKCEALGGKIARIESPAEQALANEVTKVSDYPGCVRYGSNSRCYVFIEGKRVGVGEPFKYQDGSIAHILEWGPKEPYQKDEYSQCLELNRFEGNGWNDESCTAKRNVLCDFTHQQGKIFLMVQGSFSNNESISKCNALGGKIARIETPADQYLANEATKVSDHPGCVRYGSNSRCYAFIEGKRVGVGEPFKYQDGSLVHILEWGPKEPYQKDEYSQCLEINRFEGNGWNDISCTAKRSVLCDFTQPHKQYLMVNGTFTFNEGVCMCHKLGGQIATIHYEEDKNLAYAASKASLYPGCLKSDESLGCQAFIGAKRVGEGNPFRWTNGQEAHIPGMWSHDQPDGSDEEIQCIEINRYNDTTWNDLSCDARRSVLCEFAQHVH